MDSIIPKGGFLGAGLSEMVELLDNELVAKSPWPGRKPSRFAASSRGASQTSGAPCSNRLYHETRYLALERSKGLKIRVWNTWRVKHCASIYELTCRPTDLSGTIGSSQWPRDWNFFTHTTFSIATSLLQVFSSRTVLHSKSQVSDALRWMAPSPPARQVFVPIHVRGGEHRPLRTRIFSRLDRALMRMTLTGECPFGNAPSDQVCCIHKLYQFADLTGLDMADVIRDCWLAR